MTDSQAITKVFMSYSRRDRDIVSKLTDALEGTDDIDVFRDTEDILPTEEWKGRLEQLIAQADTVVFALSPHSAASEVCAWEIEYAQSLNKRIAPIIIDETEPDAIPEPLRKYNYIFFTRDYEFDAAVANLITALNTDIDWIREHTRIGELAARWDQQRKLGARLLRGQELADAERWIASQPPNAPGPTQTHRDFVLLSRRAATRRQRYWVGGSLGALLVTSVLMVFAFVQMLEADAQRTEAEAQRAQAQQNAALAEEQRGIAEEQRSEAEVQRAEAVRNAALAQANAELAEANERRANEERDQAERERAVAEYRAALLSANEAKSLAGAGAVNEALLLLLDSAASLDAADLPESVLIAFDRVLESAREQSIVAIPGGGASFHVGRTVYYYDPDSGDLLRFDGAAGLQHVAALASPPAAIGAAGDGTRLIVASRDDTVWTVDPSTGGRTLLGQFDPLPQTDERAYDRESIDIRADDLIVWQREYSQGDSVFGLTVRIMEVGSGRTNIWDLADAGLLGYVVQPDGTRYLAPSAQMQTEALAYRIAPELEDLEPLQLQATGVPQDLAALACLGTAHPGDETFIQEIVRRLEEDFPFGMTCERFGEHLLLTEQFWSSGGGYEQYTVVRPDGTSIDAIETLSGFAQVEQVVNGLAWAAVEAETGRIGLIHGRDLYFFDEHGILFQTTLPYPPEFAHFVSATQIAVVQPQISEIRTFTVSEDPAPMSGATAVAVGEDAVASRYNTGNCTGFETDWAFGPLAFSNGDTVSFEGSVDATPVMRVDATSGRAWAVEFSPDYSRCVQFSRDLRWFLVKDERGLDIYDFDMVRRVGTLDEGRIGGIADVTLASAFFVGATPDIVTGHTDQRILRWTRSAPGDAWMDVEIYRGNAPIVYAEPDDTGDRLLIVEAESQSYYHTIYYSLAAGEIWLDLGTAYKYVNVAFTEDMDIDYFGHLNQDRQIVTPFGLDALVQSAAEALSLHCGPAVAGDYATSPCWPKSLVR